ncbi:hypothetical protein MRX96_051784 [Rhipicephalus microplus]
MLSAEDAPVPGGRSRGRSGSRRRGASKGCSGSRSRSTERARGKFHFSASLQLKAGARFVGADQGPAPARPPPLTARSRRSPGPTRPEEERESPRGDESNRGSPDASELDEMRRANEQLRKENAQLKQEMSRLAAEMAEIRKLASSPPFGAARPNPGRHGYV